MSQCKSRIHPTAYLGAMVRVEENVSIGPNCYIEGNVHIGADTRLVGGLVLVGDITIGPRCVIEPSVSLTREAGIKATEAGPVMIGAGVHVGSGSSLAAGVSIGTGARILAGTVVARNVPPHAIVSGNPATVLGYVPSETQEQAPVTPRVYLDEEPGISTCSVTGVTIHQFQRIRDLRGDLCAGEFLRNVPFNPKRYFLVFDVPSEEVRGEHAHRRCEQFLICVTGSLAVVVDDSVHREEILLNRPTRGLYIPPGIWGVQYKFSHNCALLVFASDYYDPGDYIRNYTEFLNERRLANTSLIK